MLYSITPIEMLILIILLLFYGMYVQIADASLMIQKCVRRPFPPINISMTLCTVVACDRTKVCVLMGDVRSGFIQFYYGFPFLPMLG